MSEVENNNIVSFPIQLTDKEDIDNLSNHELVQEGLLGWTRAINMAINGTYVLTDANKKSIRRFNELAAKLGYETLIKNDFENL